MIGYHKNPQSTTDILKKDGFLHTGDVGYYDREGYFYIVDRTKDLIKVKGLQVRLKLDRQETAIKYLLKAL